MEQIDIKRKVFGKNSFKNVIDTDFNQLINNTEDPIVQEQSIEEFFTLYSNLFFDIPEQGDLSHQEIINRSSEYLGISFLDLEEEIKILRQENVSLKNQLINLNQ